MPRLHRHLRRLAGAGVVTLLLMIGLLPFSPPAAAYRTGCHWPFVASAVRGLTMNHTGLELTRIYDEKGLLNQWGEEPAASIGAHDIDHWCAYANSFGTAMKVEYRFADGNVAYFEAYSYTSGVVGSSCEIKGPSADRFSCAHRTSGGEPEHIEADFTVSQRH